VWFIKLLIETEILIPLWVGIELALPMARGKPILPISKWVLRKTLSPLLNRTPTESMLASAARREKEAQARLLAAEKDLKAAKTERAAAELEDQTNDIRGEIP
jgi:hypothetical protein